MDNLFVQTISALAARYLADCRKKDAAIDQLRTALEASRVENERLKKALGYYTDPGVYIGMAGKLAREALKKEDE